MAPGFAYRARGPTANERGRHYARVLSAGQNRWARVVVRFAPDGHTYVRTVFGRLTVGAGHDFSSTIVGSAADGGPRIERQRARRARRFQIRPPPPPKIVKIITSRPGRLREYFRKRPRRKVEMKYARFSLTPRTGEFQNLFRDIEIRVFFLRFSTATKLRTVSAYKIT